MWVVRSAKFVVLLAVLTLANSICGQAQKPSPTPPPDDIIRINTELVQTDVMVFDKKGAFVEGLKPEQFELTVEGKPHSISLFEQVRAGSVREIRLLTKEKTVADSSPANETRGRTIVFFIDDLHLAPDSMERTRRALKQFLGSEMTDYDRVAIASTSGDLGFLQQFTDFKPMLQKAAERLVHHPYNLKDLTDSRTPMTEYTALAIERNEDPGVLDFYIDRCLTEAFPLKYRRESCALQVKDRARAMLVQSASVIFNTYASLESLMRSATLLPGRKLVFFFSDGFLLDTGPRNANPREKLKEITDAALRAGVVVYTVDARGLFSGQLDATNNVAFDKQNRLESTSMREGAAMQDALNALAEDTGGRALRNQNYFDRWISKVLDETSNYYLLAWRPDDHAEGPVSFKKIVVRVIDHPEYEVRMPQGFLNSPQVEAKPSTEVQSPAQAHQDLQRALTAVSPRHEIQTALSAVFIDTPEHGPVLTTSVQVRNDTLSYQTRDGKQVAAVDVAGVLVNDRGKTAGSFQTRLEIKSISNDAANENSLSIYNNRIPLPPGLYQVRVATRDIQSGRVGSAQQWVEIPNLSLGQLTLSSLLLGVQSVGVSKEQVQFSVDHRFEGKLPLGFMAFIYNATQGQGGRSIPNLSYQARLLRQGQAVFTTPLRKVLTDSQELSRIVFTGVLPLKDIAPGRYILELKVMDEANRTSATQQTGITVE